MIRALVTVALDLGLLFGAALNSLVTHLTGNGGLRITSIV